MKEGHEWKIVLYVWLLVPFGLTNNATKCFMQLMNHVLGTLIGKYVVVYLSDILIYNKNLDDH